MITKYSHYNLRHLENIVMYTSTCRWKSIKHEMFAFTHCFCLLSTSYTCILLPVLYTIYLFQASNVIVWPKFSLAIYHTLTLTVVSYKNRIASTLVWVLFTYLSRNNIKRNQNLHQYILRFMLYYVVVLWLLLLKNTA